MPTLPVYVHRIALDCESVQLCQSNDGIHQVFCRVDGGCMLLSLPVSHEHTPTTRGPDSQFRQVGRLLSCSGSESSRRHRVISRQGIRAGVQPENGAIPLPVRSHGSSCKRCFIWRVVCRRGGNTLMFSRMFLSRILPT